MKTSIAVAAVLLCAAHAGAQPATQPVNEAAAEMAEHTILYGLAAVKKATDTTACFNILNGYVEIASPALETQMQRHWTQNLSMVLPIMHEAVADADRIITELQFWFDVFTELTGDDPAYESAKTVFINMANVLKDSVDEAKIDAERVQIAHDRRIARVP